MRFSATLSVLIVAGVAQAQFGVFQERASGKFGGGSGLRQRQNNNANKGGGNGGAGGGGATASLALDPKNVQTGSKASGLEGGGAEKGQAASATDGANFINFCTGKTITNGLQVRTGSCNGIPMGDIPAAGQMVSAVFTNPKNNDVITANSAIKFSVQIANLQAGAFTNPDKTYYSAPQALTGGKVVGHTHITVQNLGGNANPTQPLDAQTFAFFKGVNDAGNGNGLLSADLAGGLPEGFYRVCSMTSSSNHQPVLMPVAQRGAQDDCVRFRVAGAGAGGGNNQANQGQAQQGQAQQGQAQQGQAQQGQAQQGKPQQGQAQQGQQAKPPGGGGFGGRGGGFGGGGSGKGKAKKQKRVAFAERSFVA